VFRRVGADLGELQLDVRFPDPSTTLEGRIAETVNNLGELRRRENRAWGMLQVALAEGDEEQIRQAEADHGILGIRIHETERELAEQKREWARRQRNRRVPVRRLRSRATPTSRTRSRGRERRPQRARAASRSSGGDDSSSSDGEGDEPLAPGAGW
jgi:hypothetical protein